MWRGGSVDKVDGKGAAVMNVGSGGRVGAVTGGATVVDAGRRWRVCEGKREFVCRCLL